jgi:hypothetical protein
VHHVELRLCVTCGLLQLLAQEIDRCHTSRNFVTNRRIDGWWRRENNIYTYIMNLYSHVWIEHVVTTD